jgi:cell wall-associated NlpC family hydrolase
VIDALRIELDAHEATVTGAGSGTAPALPPSPTTPMGVSGSMPGLGSGGGLGAGASSGLGSGVSSGLAGLDSVGSRADAQPDAVPPSVDPGTFGAGVDVRLPDGSTVTAPNAVAAGAVRNALTQLGVPYSWGGTTPGVGLDCSGLTQWAYREAGLDIPRLAQEQDIGSAVGRASLRPGDLAVWDGHVAMIAGNGLMVEAGDPVKLSPIRTTNAGQGFQGFWRPTA